MKLHWWIEMSGKRRLLVFVFAVLAILIYCAQLPDEAWRLRRRQVIPFPLTLSIIWIAGWFLLFFVRAEDLHIMAPFNFQGVTRVFGGLLIALGFVIAGLLYLIYLKP